MFTLCVWGVGGGGAVCVCCADAVGNSNARERMKSHNKQYWKILCYCTVDLEWSQYHVMQILSIVSNHLQWVLPISIPKEA